MFLQSPVSSERPRVTRGRGHRRGREKGKGSCALATRRAGCPWAALGVHASHRSSVLRVWQKGGGEREQEGAWMRTWNKAQKNT